MTVQKKGSGKRKEWLSGVGGDERIQLPLFEHPLLQGFDSHADENAKLHE